MRSICPYCHYPLTTCVCHAVTLVESPKKIVVIQHYREAKHAKNTVRLAKLCMPELTVLTVKSDVDIARCIKELEGQKCAIFYPDASALCIDKQQRLFQEKDYDTLVFIDGSWKQSKGIFNRLMQSTLFERWQLGDDYIAKYRIRKTRLSGAFSTLEAIALSLEKGMNEDSRGLFTVFEAFQQHWKGQ